MKDHVETCITREYTVTLKMSVEYKINAESETEANQLLDSKVDGREEIAKYLGWIMGLGWNEWHHSWMLKEEWGAAYPQINLVRNLHVAEEVDK